MTSSTEHFQVSLQTPAGLVTTEVGVPTSHVPITSIVPVMRALGQQAQELEEQQVTAAGASVSCRKGCAACCRMLVPLSVPEAFALQASIERLPPDKQAAVRARLDMAKHRLQEGRLWDSLESLSESPTPPTDEELEPLNRAYYALRMPCPFLEQEQCGIYDDRPAACRELLVTSPPEFCNDLTDARVRPLPLSLRISTALGLLWAELTGTAACLIPLPVALDWAHRHQAERQRTWPGNVLFEKAVDKLWRYLSHEFGSRQKQRWGAKSHVSIPRKD